MKKGFTLVELMIVTVVLVVLLTMMFKLTNVIGDSSAMNVTVDRMHRLENALSGYYAAFGTYPPVKVHGSRNPFLPVNNWGDQDLNGSENTSIWGWTNAEGTSVENSQEEERAWRQVRAACVAQPVACSFPFPKNKMKDFIDRLSDYKRENLGDEKDEVKKMKFTIGFDDGVSKNIGRFSQYKDGEWPEIKLFRFGVMSYLLPRYLFMMYSEDDFFDYAQWKSNNTLPRDPLTGKSMNNWSYVQSNYILKDNLKNSDTAHVANIPSQAVCARWIANFEHMLTCNYSHILFGVELWERKGNAANETVSSSMRDLQAEDIFAPGGYDNADSSAQYILDKITLRDGWERDFYYYCPAPYQSYMVWSAGPNGRTFPPWISRENLDSSARRCVGYWTRDDVVNLSH